MTVKTATISNPAFAVAVAQVQSDLAAWRKRRKPKEPIPELLWYEMAQMARSYGLSAVAYAFRINYYGLKRRVMSTPLERPNWANYFGSRATSF
jgi:hypothetical protein